MGAAVGPGRSSSCPRAAGWSDVLGRAECRARERTRTYEVSLVDGLAPARRSSGSTSLDPDGSWSSEGAVFDHRIGSEIDRDTLAELFALHGMRSASVGRRTTFTEARSAFHERLAARSTATNASFVVRARLDGALVGGLYGFLDGERVHYYQSGWDPELERSSLGSILIGEAIDLALERGARTFDFLRGDEPYKLRFGAQASVDSSFLRADAVRAVSRCGRRTWRPGGSPSCASGCSPGDPGRRLRQLGLVRLVRRRHAGARTALSASRR